jgi:hypothetical protein
MQARCERVQRSDGTGLSARIWLRWRLLAAQLVVLEPGLGRAAGAASGYSAGGPVGAVIGGAIGTATGTITRTANALSPPPPAPYPFGYHLYSRLLLPEPIELGATARSPLRYALRWLCWELAGLCVRRFGPTAIVTAAVAWCRQNSGSERSQSVLPHFENQAAGLNLVTCRSSYQTSTLTQLLYASQIRCASWVAAPSLEASITEGGPRI